MATHIYKNSTLALLFFSIVAFTCMTPQNLSAEVHQYGDGIAFPHSCVDFSGLWLNGSGSKVIRIEQKRCKSANITFAHADSWEEASFNIQLDGKTWTVHSGREDIQTLTSSWDSLDHGSVLEVLLRHHFRGRDRILFVLGAELSYEEGGVLSVIVEKEIYINGEASYRMDRKKELFYKVKE